MPRPSSVRTAAAIVLALTLALTGCAVSPVGASSAAVGPTSSPTPTGPAPDAIRQLDAATLDWQWFDNFASITPVDTTGPDELGRTYEIGKPAYSDADGDGLVDMAVPITQRDGNGFREQWHIWLATADGTAVQVSTPIALTARCGDTTKSVSATTGGFAVHEFLREPVVDDRLPCSAKGTHEVTRRVGVVRSGDSLDLVDLADPRGYGGLCPTHPRTETSVVKVWGSAGPRIGAPLTIDGEKMFLILTYPHTLTQGADPMRLAAVWPPDGSAKNRLCVWIDPARYEGG